MFGKKLIAVFSAAALALSFAGCTSTASANSNTGSAAGNSPAASNSSGVDVGIVLPTKDEPRWVQDETRFRDALGSTNYSVEILFSQGSSAKEKENVEALIAKDIDVLIICPQDATAAAASVEAAKAEGITVISYDRLITDTEAVDYYVTFDSVAVGKAQGQYLIDNVSGMGLGESKRPV